MGNIKERLTTYFEIKFKKDVLDEYSKRCKECYRRSPSILNNAQMELIRKESIDAVSRRPIYVVCKKVL